MANGFKGGAQGYIAAQQGNFQTNCITGGRLYGSTLLEGVPPDICKIEFRLILVLLYLGILIILRG